jgi:hypothetical protein
MPSLKKYLVGLSSAALVLGSVASLAGVASAQTAASPPFSDIAGSPNQAAITFLASIGAVNGVGNGLFDPTAPVTRAEFAKMIVNTLGLGNVASALANETPSFKDAAKIPTWAWGYINVAADDGIFVGYPNGTFGANNDVTDAQAATAIIRALNDTSQVANPTVSAAWPGNFVTAAYSLGLTTGVNFVANLPATRGDVAQLLYNAAVSVPTYVANNTTPVTYTKYPPIYLGGYTGNNVGGFYVYNGTVTNVNATSITIEYSGTGSAASDFQPACPVTPTVVGTTYECQPTFNWASSYQLVGATSATSLLNGTVTLLYNTSANDVVYAGLTSGAAANTAVLATSSTTVPAGFYALGDNESSSPMPWLVTNSYTCAEASNQGADSQLAESGGSGATAYTVTAGVYTEINGSSCTYYLLLGGTTPTTIQLAGLTPSNGTSYEVNPSSNGVDLGTVSGTGTSAVTLNATYLTAGDTIQYTLNSSKLATVVSEQNVNLQVGRVTSTSCVSGCDNTISVGATPYIVVNVGGKGYDVYVQPYTTLTVNGKSATLSSSLDNDIAYVSEAGGYGTNSGQTNVGTGDGNGVTIALYQNQVSGTVTSVSTSSSAPNLCATGQTSGCNTDEVVSFVLNGTTYTADSNFSGSVAPGNQVTIALDSSGEARAVVTTNQVTTAAVGVVTGTGESLSLSGVTQNVVINGATYTVSMPNNAVYTSVYSTFNSTPYTSSPPDLEALFSSPYTNNGAVLFETSNGQAVGPSGTGLPMPLTIVQPPAGTGSCWVVLATTSTTATLQGYSACGTSNAAAINGSYLTAVLGNGFNNSGGVVGFSGLTDGHVAVVYENASPINGETFYAVIDSGNGPTTAGTAE